MLSKVPDSQILS